MTRLPAIPAAPKKKALRKELLRFFLSLGAAVLLILFCYTVQANAAGIDITIDSGEGNNSLGIPQILFLFALLALAPTLLLMMTSFTRIIIVFSILRNAIGLQQTPPNQVLIGMAIILSLFVMTPVLNEINETALDPYTKGTITQEEALDAAQKPVKIFMLRQTGAKELNMFLSMSGEEQPEVTEVKPDDLLNLDLKIVMPAFVTSELKRAFTIGFLLFIPFLVIDMVVSSVLMSMGMVMLPPSMISLPFKLMLFVVVDGWGLIMDTLVQGFH